MCTVILDTYQHSHTLLSGVVVELKYVSRYHMSLGRSRWHFQLVTVHKRLSISALGFVVLHREARISGESANYWNPSISMNPAKISWINEAQALWCSETKLDLQLFLCARLHTQGLDPIGAQDQWKTTSLRRIFEKYWHCSFNDLTILIPFVYWQPKRKRIMSSWPFPAWTVTKWLFAGQQIWEGVLFQLQNVCLDNQRPQRLRSRWEHCITSPAV